MLDAATQQAFLQALEEQPDFRAAVRRHLLTQELLELPERFAEYSVATERRLTNLETTLASFMESTELRLQALEQGQDELKSGMSEVKAELAKVHTRLGSMDGRLGSMDGRLDSMDARFDSMDARFDSMDGRLDSMDARFDSMDGRLDSMDARFDSMDGRLDSMDARFDSMDGRLDSMDARFDSMDARLDRMDGRMDNGFGTNYEIKVANNFGSIAGRNLRLRRTRVLKAAMTRADGNLNNMIADAEDRGAITEEQAVELLAVDLIASGRSRDNGHDVYVAAEVSITVADQDIARAAERAEYLARATGQAAVPAVVGENIAPEQEELARQRSVTVMLLPAG
ncbi:MAG: hypothetical protein OXI54_09130 [Chloroflexota bacterium]|nr:hypothetical protein [Chloroflexota bacterium]